MVFIHAFHRTWKTLEYKFLCVSAYELTYIQPLDKAVKICTWPLHVITSRFLWVTYLSQMYITTYWSILLHPASLCGPMYVSANAICMCEPSTPSFARSTCIKERWQENMWRRKENDSGRERPKKEKSKGKTGRTERGNRDAVGHLFEHKYLCQRSQCWGTNYVESAQLCSLEEKREIKDESSCEKTKIRWASVQVVSCSLLCLLHFFTKYCFRVAWGFVWTVKKSQAMEVVWFIVFEQQCKHSVCSKLKKCPRQLLDVLKPLGYIFWV